MDNQKTRILVAVDGSNQSLDAVRYVGKMLNPQKTDVVLFNVMRKIKDAVKDIGANPDNLCRFAPIMAWESTQRMTMEEFMKKANQSLIDDGYPKESVFMKIHECEVGVARDILREADSGYRAVVIGRRGISRLMDIMIGSVAHKLMVALTNTPLWIVGSTPWPRRVLIGLDHSQGAMKAVDHVGHVLGGTNTEVILLNVLRSPSFMLSDVEDLPLDKQKEVYDLAKEEIASVFEKAATALTMAGFTTKQITTKLISGVPSRAGTIVNEAERGGCGTIVIGRRGISKVEEFYMGRVCNKVINIARDMAVWVVS